MIVVRDRGRLDRKIAVRGLKARSLQYHAVAINRATRRRICGRDVRSRGIEREEHVALSQRLMIAQLREDEYIRARARTHTVTSSSLVCFDVSPLRKDAVNGEKNIADLSRNKII